MVPLLAAAASGLRRLDCSRFSAQRDIRRRLALIFTITYAETARLCLALRRLGTIMLTSLFGKHFTA